jgi:hypothetical protein
MVSWLKRIWLQVAAAILVGAVAAVVAVAQQPGQRAGSAPTTDTPPTVTQPATPPNIDNGTGEQIQIPAEIPTAFVSDCHDRLAADPSDKGCAMLIQAANGQIPPGVYPESKAEAVLHHPQEAARFRMHHISRSNVPSVRSRG